QRRVAYPMPQELHHPGVVHIVEEASDISVYHAADWLCHDDAVEPSQRLVTAPSRAKSIREIKEVPFIDRFEYSSHSHLDDFVLRRWDTQGPQLTVGLRNVGPSYWLRMIGLPLHSRHKALQVLVEGFLIFFNSDAVCPCCFPFLEHPEALF